LPPDRAARPRPSPYYGNATGLPRLARRVERERLAGPRRRAHDLHPTSASGDRRDELSLLGRDRRPVRQRSRQRVLAHRGCHRTRVLRALDRGVLDPQQFTRAVATLADHRLELDDPLARRAGSRT
jgi:hypothetical protein